MTTIFETLKNRISFKGAAPTLRQKKVTLVLGGGVALGMAHIGVIEVLEAHNITPDLLVGTSAGAMAGAMYCAGLNPPQMLEYARELTWRRISRFCVPKMGLMDGRRMEKWIQEILPTNLIEEAPHPFAAVVTNLYTSRKEIIVSGPFASAVHASCALPGIFVPVNINDNLYVDGGLVDEVPVRSARELGATLVIAVQIHSAIEGLPPPKNIFEIIMRGQFIRSRRLNRDEVQGADVVIMPQASHMNAYDMSKTDTLVEIGRIAAEEKIPEILEKLDQ